MKLINGLKSNYLNDNSQLNFVVFSLLTVLSLLNGQTTVFYLIYFFWWFELIRITVDRLCYKNNPKAKIEEWNTASIFGSFFLMGIYFVFIVVFFGIIANWENPTITTINLKVVLFQNWFFNLNLLFVLAERLYIHKAKLPVTVSFGHFTPNMIILHLAIMLGGLIMFFIVKNYPELFTPTNLWGSVLIVLPFLFLKMLGQWLSLPNKQQH